jgi:methylenetetrahydrofolate dehydrogenase (NADP+)/methenyltetrahydrofolate cyclohydrolase
MVANIIDGKVFSEGLRAVLGRHVDSVKKETGETPGLAVVLVGDDPASQIYVKSKGKKTKEVGMKSFSHQLPATVSQEELLALVQKLNQDPEVSGILVQLPLPKSIDSIEIINAIAPEKDVDGLNIYNAGALVSGQSQKALIPCTPLASITVAPGRIQSPLTMLGRPIAAMSISASPTINGRFSVRE